MAAIFDSYNPMSFGGIRWPFKRYTCHVAGRKHIHEYPHTPGGAPEKLGRSLYEFTIEGIFDGNLLPERYRGLKLWPNAFNYLRHMAETQDTDKLVIPTLGTIDAFIDDFSWTCTNMVLSGPESVNIKFGEDSSAAFIASQIASVSVNGLETAGQYFTETAAPYKISVFDLIANLYADVVAYRDTLGMYSDLFESKLLGLLQALAFAEKTVRELNEPQNFLMLDALHELWRFARMLQNDTQSMGAVLRTYTTGRQMALADVSTAIYGDSTHSGDLLGLNVIADPFSIKAGTAIRYYADNSNAGGVLAA